MFKIIGKKVNVKDYLDSNKDNMNWTPTFCVLHNTATPSLKQRPNGFTEDHMKNLQQYYSNQGWKGGPHFFVDQNGVWAFNPITTRGTHSPSWNAKAIGVEMLGDYNEEQFLSGDGAKVRTNALQLMADLHTFFKFDPDTMKIHKEDPKTTHDCPGKNVIKADFVASFKSLMNPSAKKSKIYIYKKGESNQPVGILDGQLINGYNHCKVEDMEKILKKDISGSGLQKVYDMLQDDYTYAWDDEINHLYCVEK